MKPYIWKFLHLVLGKICSCKVGGIAQDSILQRKRNRSLRTKQVIFCRKIFIDFTKAILNFNFSYFHTKTYEMLYKVPFSSFYWIVVQSLSYIFCVYHILSFDLNQIKLLGVTFQLAWFDIILYYYNRMYNYLVFVQY